MNFDFNILVFLIGIAVILFTPGPTNTLLAAAGLSQGTRKALPLVVVELAGYMAAISGWGVFLATVQSRYPWCGVMVCVASSCYLAYIAVKLWRTTLALPMSKQRPIGPKILFIATLLNPKALVFASTIFPLRAFGNVQIYLAAMTSFACLLLPIGSIWIKFGAVLGNGRVSFMSPISLQRTAALAIGMFSVSIAWTAFSRISALY